MNEFVRFDDRPLQPRKLKGMEEFLCDHPAIDGRKVAAGYDYTIWQVVSYVMWVWRTHRPQTNNSGVFAFVNAPSNINPYIVPSCVIEGMHREYKATIERSWKDNFEDTIRNTPSKFEFAQIIDIKNVRVVWAHHIINWVRNHFEWKRYTAQEYLKISDKSDIYEVFLELR